MKALVLSNLGQIKVISGESGKAMQKVYVKCYAKMKNQQDAEAKFYKDGYTDLRGCFDYVSLNTDKLKHVESFALLVVAD